MHGTVMMDGRYLGRWPSGIGRYCFEVVGAMQRQAPALRWQFVVKRPGDHAPLDGEEAAPFDAEIYGLRTSVELGRRLGPAPADVFHSPFHVLPRGLSCATVITMHDVFNFMQPVTSNYPFPVSWIEWAYFLAAIPDSLRRAHRIICVSQATADRLLEMFPALSSKVRVVHHGVSKRFHRCDPEAVDATCARLVGERPFFVAIGSISPNKNHLRQLEAFAHAFPHPGGPLLVRISRMGDEEPLRRRARELGVADRVVSLRTSTDDEVVHLLNGATALSFCSTVEGFGLPVLEAMACGCPVLTSTSSCLREVGGDAALYASPFDVPEMARQLRRLVEEPGLRGELRAAGLERATFFDWDRAAREHLEVYREARARA